LTPIGWAALVGRSARGVGDGMIAATTVFGDIDALAARISAAGDTDGRVGALDAFMVARRARALTVDPRIAAIDAWIVAGAPGDSAGLAAQLGLSRRSLERLTTATHGATPKLIAAKYRALMAAGRLAVEGGDWREPAVSGAFADQSHFIREFKRFVGMTPGAFVAAPQSLVARLIRGQWAPGRALGIAIWNS
jgi:AraC-like DNA-binding protein